jgi:hypothetical protein
MVEWPKDPESGEPAPVEVATILDPFQRFGYCFECAPEILQPEKSN